MNGVIKTIPAELKNVVSQTIHSSYEEIVSKLGQPLKETDNDGFLILRYHSNSPSLASYLYLKDGRLVYKSIGIGKSELQLQFFLDAYKQPERSLLRYGQGDSLGLIAHIWPNQGIAAISMGSLPSSSLYQIQEFIPMSLEEYFKTWGKEFANNQIIQVETQLSTSQKSSPVLSKFLPLANSELIVSIFLLVVVLLVWLLVLRTKKR